VGKKKKGDRVKNKNARGVFGGGRGGGLVSKNQASLWISRPLQKADQNKETSLPAPGKLGGVAFRKNKKSGSDGGWGFDWGIRTQADKKTAKASHLSAAAPSERRTPQEDLGEESRGGKVSGASPPDRHLEQWNKSDGHLQRFH